MASADAQTKSRFSWDGRGCESYLTRLDLKQAYAVGVLGVLLGGGGAHGEAGGPLRVGWWWFGLFVFHVC